METKEGMMPDEKTATGPKNVTPPKGAAKPARDERKAKEFAGLKLQERIVELALRIDKAEALGFDALATRLGKQKAEVETRLAAL
jgi:hypothetical protein